MNYLICLSGIKFRFIFRKELHKTLTSLFASAKYEVNIYEQSNYIISRGKLISIKKKNRRLSWTCLQI